MRKKIIHTAKFLLLLLTILPSFSTLLFQLCEEKIERRMRNELKSRPGQTIVVHKSDFQWLDAGKEIWVHNRAFDVSSVRRENELFIFTGLFDEDETFFMVRQQMNQEDESNNNAKILASFFGLFEISPENNNSLFVVYTKSKQRFPCYTSSLSAVFSSVIIPPPRAGDVDNTSA